MAERAALIGRQQCCCARSMRWLWPCCCCSVWLGITPGTSLVLGVLVINWASYFKACNRRCFAIMCTDVCTP
jgi:hypothetical protein